MKSWKTTLAGLLAGLPIGLNALMQAYNAGTLTGKTGGQLVLALGIILLGAYSKDHNVTGGAKVILLVIGLGAGAAGNAQSPFKAIPKVIALQHNPFVHAATATITPDSILNAWRVITVAAAYSEPGNLLMAGMGYGYQHLSYDYSAQKWVCKWSISPVAFAGGSVVPSTPASIMSIGLLGGIDNNLIMAGPVYNFGTKQFGVGLSIGINLNN